MTAPDAEEIRRTQRKFRHAVPADELERRSLAAVGRLARSDWWTHARTIAIYAAIGGELRPEGLLDERRDDQRLHVPVLADDALRFVAVTEQTTWMPNRFGIAEPIATEGGSPIESLGATLLDLVIVPCVAVDRSGHRIGMGGGWYDRTFSFLNRLDRPSAPLMIGFVHDEQLVDIIDPSPWDIGLDGIVTPTRTIVPSAV